MVGVDLRSILFSVRKNIGVLMFELYSTMRSPCQLAIYHSTLRD